MYRIIPVHHFHSTWHIHLICTCMSISCSQMTRVMKLLTTLYHTHATHGMHTSQPDKTSSLIHYSSHIHYTWNGLSGLTRAGLTHKQTKHVLCSLGHQASGGHEAAKKKKNKARAGAPMLDLVSQNWNWCPQIGTAGTLKLEPKLELGLTCWNWCPQ